MDVMPTLLDLAFDGSLETVDGKSFENVLMRKENWADRTVFWHEKKSRPYSTGDIPCSVIRSGNYKLMHFFEADRYELYDLSKDISEEKNLINDLPDIASKMKAELKTWKTNYLTSANLNRKIKDGSKESTGTTGAEQGVDDEKAKQKEAKKAAKKAERKAAKKAGNG
jgi:arylsulfatase A-like enzyme